MHQIPGRLRLRIPLLYKNDAHGKSLKSALNDYDGIRSVAHNAVTGSLVIIYQNDKMSANDLLALLSFVLDGKSEGSQRELPLCLIRRSSKIDPQLYTALGENICSHFNSHPGLGLQKTEAADRLRIMGPNVLTREQSKSVVGLFIGQLDNFLVKLLLGASGAAFLLGDWVDAISILAIVFIEAALGVVQEYKAEKSLSALSRLASPQAKVIREGEEMVLSSEMLVPGDIVLLEAGNSVPADGRLLECNNLEAVERTLTGESTAVFKTYQPLSSVPQNPGDMYNMVFMGTNIIRGRGKMVVVSTGMDTQMGTIARMLTDVEESATPLKHQLDKLGILITGICIACSSGILLVGVMTGRPVMEMARLGIALAVGAIPESLSSIVTITMAVGIQRMVQQNAIVRKLPAIETLAHTTVICSDKTGTLTANEMTVKEIYTANCLWQLTGEGYSPQGTLNTDLSSVSHGMRHALELFLTAGVLCNNAELYEKNGLVCVDGDPTEAALLVAAAKYGIPHGTMRDQWTRSKEIPFEAERMRMLTINADTEGQNYVFLKGAVDVVLPLCSQWLSQDGPMAMDEVTSRHIAKVNAGMADKALRVLALAYKPVETDQEKIPADSLEEELIFLGLSGMIDPPKPYVREAIDKCNRAGVKVVMITGDHPNTATAIAKNLDILRDGKTITGSMLSEMSDDALMDMIDDIHVFTRTAPEQKLRIVKAFKEKGYIVAMTGDGINDAPAVKESNVGIAMGKNGTDVTREASAITLADDNFSTIVAAMEEGRTINQNIRRFIRYVLSGNLGEVILLFLSAATTLPMPMNATQILFVNLATEGLPALAIGVDAPVHRGMAVNGRQENTDLFDKELKTQVLKRGSLTGLGAFGIFAATYLSSGNLMHSQSMAFTSLVTSQLFHAVDCRQDQDGRTRAANPYLIPSIAVSAGLLLSTLYIPGLRSLFHTLPLGWLDWLLILLSSGLISTIDKSIQIPSGYLKAPSMDMNETNAFRLH